MSDLTSSFPGYEKFLRDLKQRIRTAQVRAALAVNRELVLLYWQIGHDILERQQQYGWGAKVIDRLSADLKREFPDMQGFSVRNLKYMRAFTDAWPNEQFVQQLAAQIPWFHHCILLDKIHNPAEREWYIRATVEHGWSRNVLVHQIESKLYERQGKAVTNFERTLPAPQADLARQLLKDPYNFDFLTLGREAAERNLEQGLLDSRVCAAQYVRAHRRCGIPTGGIAAGIASRQPADRRTVGGRVRLPGNGRGRGRMR